MRPHPAFADRNIPKEHRLGAFVLKVYRSDKGPIVRAAAVRALGFKNYEHLASRLATVCRKAREKDVQIAAMEALHGMGAPQREHVYAAVFLRTKSARVCELASACGKNPIVVNDNPRVWGFVANRVYGAMLREAAQVVAEGVASRDDVNQLMVDCFNWPIGPYGMVQGATKGWK